VTISAKRSGEVEKQSFVDKSVILTRRDAKTCDEVYAVMKQDFFVVTPCFSNRTGKMLEGTRLTLQRTEPEGWEYSIRTPGTPPRWIDYDLEMKHVFQLLTDQIRSDPNDIEKISDLILTNIFYWYNFMPLSRGTAACGYVTLVGMFLSVGYKINRLVPTKFLVDWEGILRSKPGDFIQKVKPWMYPARDKIDIEEFNQLPQVNEVFSTLRKVIQGLNAEY